MSVFAQMATYLKAYEIPKNPLAAWFLRIMLEVDAASNIGDFFGCVDWSDLPIVAAPLRGLERILREQLGRLA
jgi:hypothetical protein